MSHGIILGIGSINTVHIPSPAVFCYHVIGKPRVENRRIQIKYSKQFVPQFIAVGVSVLLSDRNIYQHEAVSDFIKSRSRFKRKKIAAFFKLGTKKGFGPYGESVLCRRGLAGPDFQGIAVCKTVECSRQKSVFYAGTVAVVCDELFRPESKTQRLGEIERLVGNSINVHSGRAFSVVHSYIHLVFGCLLRPEIDDRSCVDG